MPIQTLEEYDKVLNVSWYAPEASREEQEYVYIEIVHDFQFPDQPPNNFPQVPMYLALLQDVSPVLYRYSELLESVLFLRQ